MKGVTTVKTFLTVLTAIALFGLVACEGPAGPAGKDGASGTKGADGKDAGFVYFEGFKADLKCATCHSADTDTAFRVITKKTQYETSGHKELGNYDRNTTTCAGCHTNEGFLERHASGFANETFTINAASGPIVKQSYPNSSPVACFTCHAPHKRGDFTIRDSGSVKIFTLVAGQTTKTWNSTTSSNLCVKCHQPRMTSHFLIPGSTSTSFQPDPTNTGATDTAKIYTTRWNNHVSGEQSQSLLGFGGFEFAGYAPGFPSSYHTTAVTAKTIGCETCHMATPIGNKGGGHTFKVGYIPEGSTTLSYNLAGCNTTGCHTGVTSSNATYWVNPRAEIKAKLSQLGKMLADTNVTKKYSLPKSGKAVAWVSMSVSGTDTTWSGANASSSSPLVIVPAARSGALWNLQFVQSEYSKGIHNLKYSRALLDASIAEMQK